MRPPFADTFYFVALIDQRDQHHQRVRFYARSLRTPVVTTRWVLMETANALAGDPCRPRLVTFLKAAETNPRVRLVGSSDELYAHGLGLFASRPDKAWSLTDCISMLVMSDEGLTEALTRDRHFEQAGLTAVFVD